MKNAEQPDPDRSDGWFYVLAALCGMGAGWTDVIVNDLLFTALLVLASCIMMGLLRPRRPWRWVIVVGACIPLTELAAYKILTVKPTRAQIYGSFLAALPGIAGAYGGLRVGGVVGNLRPGKEGSFPFSFFPFYVSFFQIHTHTVSGGGEMGNR